MSNQGNSNQFNNNNNNNNRNFYQGSQYPPQYPYNYLPYNNNNQAQMPNQNYWNYQYQYQQQATNFYQQYQQYPYPPPQPNTQNSNNFYNRPKNFQRNSNANYQGQNQSNNQNNNQNRNHRNFNNNNNNNNNNNYKNNFNKQKNKINKRDLPENNQFYCEVCDRGFKTDDKYKEHCDTHRTCGVNGCKFTAAEKLVEIHYRNFHASGLDKKLTNLQSPEEIQKYINERKKNFPTQKNMEKKLNLEKEKSDRGVALDTRQFGIKCFQQENKSNQDEKQLDTENKENDQIDRVNKRKQFKRAKNKKGGLFSRKVEVLKNRYKKPTLLQKLLADEIRHERNIILQCVRYVVQRNFFEKQSLTSSKSAETPVQTSQDQSHY